MFNFIKDCQSVFFDRSGCMISYSHQQCLKILVSKKEKKKILVSLHPCQHLMLSLF